MNKINVSLYKNKLKYNIPLYTTKEIGGTVNPMPSGSLGALPRRGTKGLCINMHNPFFILNYFIYKAQYKVL